MSQQASLRNVEIQSADKCVSVFQIGNFSFPLSSFKKYIFTIFKEIAGVQTKGKTDTAHPDYINNNNHSCD